MSVTLALKLVKVIKMVRAFIVYLIHIGLLIFRI